MGNTERSPSPTWFGHPRGLSTLFFTEMWERFSYYGMRALLVLFMTAASTSVNPGLGFSVGVAGAVYGLYTFFVYVLALPGGWIADHIWGQRRAVFVGGCIIAAGHFAMAGPLIGLPDHPSFFLGLVLIVIGTGLLKPNVSTMVADLYPEGGARRDAGFSIFYTGINLGAFLGPILAGLLGEGFNWHWGFSLAGVGMVLGLVQYRLGGRYLEGVGILDEPEEILKQRGRKAISSISIISVLVVGGGYFLLEWLSLEVVASLLGYAVIGVVVVYFWYLLRHRDHTALDRKRLVVIFWLVLLAAVFWSGFEQAGTSLNLFASEHTNRDLGFAEVPASWLQSVNALFIIVLAPVFGSLWIFLAKINRNPSIPYKFALGLLGLSAGFFVVAWGAANSVGTDGVSPAWLVVTYFLHTVGELCLSPVGLSSVTKLAPKGRVGQMMGLWFIAAALGNLFAGLVAGRLETTSSAELFEFVAILVAGAGIVALLLARPVKRMMGDID